MIRRDNVEYHEGVAAAKAGKTLDHNKYTAGGERAERWALGWKDTHDRNRQMLTLDTVMGPREIVAPGGSFDKTATIAWARLLTETRNKDFKRQRDKFMCEAKIEVLSIVLANAVGMASFYWVMTAREIVAEEQA